MPTAFRATFSDMKIIKTRQQVQLVFELPLADFDQAYNVLGGLPNPASEQWFAIAPLRKEVVNESPRPQAAPGAKRSWQDLSPQQQAGIRCDDIAFTVFLQEERPEDWHEASDAAQCVRLICGVESRSELETNQKARVIWHQLDQQYGAWKALEHV